MNDIPQEVTPFPVSPKGESYFYAPSPLGEGWDGGLNTFNIKLFVKYDKNEKTR